MNQLLRSAALLIAVAALFSSCRTTGNIRIPYPVAPAVSLPEHLQSIGVVDRSRPLDDGGKALNVVEGVLTGEGIREDGNGAKACISGATVQLNMDQLVAAKSLDSIALQGVTGGTMPLPLSWNEVSAICQQQGVDGLLVLEVFDTDQAGSKTGYAANQVVSIVKTGNAIPVPPPSNSAVFVKMAWRLYDPQSQSILDEIRMSDQFGVNGSPYDLGDFAKRDAIQQSAYIGGRSYSSRFFPTWMYVNRAYYRRPGPDLASATRYAQMNDFEAAMEGWSAATNSHKRKIAGRACYNLAIGYEIRGDIQSALDWAQKAYGNYRCKLARDYARELKRRL
jgi:hypothetical protein